jgi:hypothetical protein
MMERTVDREAYRLRFEQRIYERLTGPKSVWTGTQAREAAKAEWEAHESDVDFLEKPEDDADECLSYWEE